MSEEKNESSSHKSHEFEEANTDFKSFAESVGPQGLSYIVNTQVHLARRAFWIMVFIVAVTQSILIMIANGKRFYEYPSTMKSTDPVNAQFPKVTICLNSMHSKSGMAHNYPGLDKALPFYYGQQDKHHNEYQNLNWTWLNSLDMSDVMKKTTSTYWVQACMFQNRDCGQNWKIILTMYGYCLQLNPSSDVFSQEDNSGDEGRTPSLSIIFAYNKTDWGSVGWIHNLEGFTAYYTAIDDEVLEPFVLLTDETRGVPIVTLRQKRTELLGEPYSQCRRSGSSLLHYKKYTKNQCLSECLMKEVHERCNCSAPYFPREWKSGNLTKPVCRFQQHAECVTPILDKNFNYGGCDCPEECDSVSTHHEAVQYGQFYAQRGSEKESNPIVMTSMMLYMDQTTNVNREYPEYSKPQLLSDIGGAAGLTLGIAFVIGIFEWIFISLTTMIKTRHIARRQNDKDEKQHSKLQCSNSIDSKQADKTRP